TSAHIAFIENRKPRIALDSSRIEDSCPRRTARPTFHRARGLIRPSKRESQVRSVNTAAAVYGGGPIACSFLTALPLPRRCASASAKAQEADSPDPPSPIL